MNPFLVSVMLIAVLLKSDPVLACAVCGIGEDESTGAFMISTAMLTFTPLFALGGLGYMVYRRFNPGSRSLRDILSLRRSKSDGLSDDSPHGESSTAGDQARS